MANEKKEGPFPPPRDHRIPPQQAIELARRYQRASPASEKGGFFWADSVRRLLKKPNVVGMRYYHGLDEKGGYHIILVGVDKDGKDIVRQVVGGSPTPPKGGKAVKALAAMTTLSDEDPLENHFPCPPFCSTSGPFV